MRRTVIYSNGAVSEAADDAAAREALGRTDVLVWTDIQAPDDDDFALLRDGFHFHPLALEDAARGGQRAKVDPYDDYSLIVLFDLALEESSEQVRTRELMLFVGRNFVVSLHAEVIAPLDEVWGRLQRDPRIIEPHPLGFLVHQIADGLVDNYFPIVDEFDDRLSDLEEQLFDGVARLSLTRLFTMRKSLIAMRRLVNQMRDVFNILLRREEAVFHESTLPYFTDVYDHLLRISDTLELQRDLAAGALESYLSIQSNDLNITVRKLTAVTLLLMIPTLIAGIYGMNFQYMPELEWVYGYPLAIVAMLGSALGVWLYLKRAGWM